MQSLETLKQHGVEETAELWTEEVKAVSNTVSQFANDQDQQFKKLWSTVDVYVSEEVKRDLPTGMH